MLDQPISREVANYQYLSLQGMVNVPPNHDVSIQPHFEGFAADIRVIEGTKVKKGDILFRLINPDFITVQEDYLMDKATVEYLGNVLDRTKILHAEKVTADQDLEEMEMNYRISKANLEAAKRIIKMMKLPIDKIKADNLFESIPIIAPIDGYVSLLNITAGEFINTCREAISIVSMNDIHLELNAFEKDLAFLSEGKELLFRMPEISKHEHRAEIFLIGKSIDPQTRMVRVHAHPVSEDLELLQGMFVEARMKIQGQYEIE